jgi:hypothetical protein
MQRWIGGRPLARFGAMGLFVIIAAANAIAIRFLPTAFRRTIDEGRG